MCKNIRPLFNFDPPATDDEIHDAALQFIRKISGFTKPSKANEEIFYSTVNDICLLINKLLFSMTTRAAPKDREIELEKIKQRNAKRFPKA